MPEVPHSEETVKAIMELRRALRASMVIDLTASGAIVAALDEFVENKVTDMIEYLADTIQAEQKIPTRVDK